MPTRRGFFRRVGGLAAGLIGLRVARDLPIAPPVEPEAGGFPLPEEAAAQLNAMFKEVYADRLTGLVGPPRILRGLEGFEYSSDNSRMLPPPCKQGVRFHDGDDDG